MVCCFSIRKLLDSFERGETQLIVSVSLELEKILKFGARREGHQVQQISLHSYELGRLVESVIARQTCERSAVRKILRDLNAMGAGRFERLESIVWSCNCSVKQTEQCQLVRFVQQLQYDLCGKRWEREQAILRIERCEKRLDFDS